MWESICANFLGCICGGIQNITLCPLAVDGRESGALRREREAPLRSGKKSGRTAFLRQNFRVDRFLFWTESVSDCFSMQTTLLTCQHGAGGGAWADLLETRLLEVCPTCQLLLLQDLVFDLSLLVELIECVDNDGDRERDDEDAHYGAARANHLPWTEKNRRKG